MNETVDMVCSQHPNLSDCPDAVIAYSPQFDEYGLMIHDGGTSRVLIAFCPFCGSRLPQSKRERWFAELERRGVHDPWAEPVPAGFESDEWWRKA
jgi:hypothetical protein